MWYENFNVLSFIGLVVVVAIIATIYIYKGEKENAKKIILGLVVKAENDFGDKTGDKKYATVLGFAYSYLPAVVRLFISLDTLDSMIETAVKYLKTVLTPIVVTAEDKAKLATEAAKLATEEAAKAAVIAKDTATKAEEAAAIALAATTAAKIVTI